MERPEHVPLELLQTFIAIADLQGDAATAAEHLAISQPTMSKRLAALRRATSAPSGQDWLLLKGKRWIVTPEGRRVYGVVANVVQRYQQMEEFVAGNLRGRPLVSLACGQQAAVGFVKTAVEKFLKSQADCCVRLSTPRGQSRIEGVAGGEFDIAVVTDSPAAIRRIARIDLYIETIFEDHFVLAANPPTNSDWGKRWNALPKDRPLSAKDLLDFPFVLPESNAARRKQFDDWAHRAAGRRFDAVLETGGWQNILEFVNDGIGVGLVTRGALNAFLDRRRNGITERRLHVKEFPPDEVRLITRRRRGKYEPELTPAAAALKNLLVAEK